MMNSVAVFVMYLAGALCQYQGKNYYSGYGPPPRPHFSHGHNSYNSDKIHYEDQNNEPFDRNPSRIPTLMNPSECVGMLDAREQSASDRCFSAPNCDPSAAYRTMDGGCNNLKFPVWGRSRTSVVRIVQADYSDGTSEVRRAKSGHQLPNVRQIRTTIFRDMNKPALKNNVLVMQFGQMIAHDTELTVFKKSSNGSDVVCCNPDGTTPSNLPKGCMPITAPPNDPVPGKQCLSSPRGADTSDLGCSIRPVRQQLDVTSFLDASLVYGSDDETARSLRSFTDGKLAQQIGPKGRSFLPNVPRPSEVCRVNSEDTVCYASGDIRVNQHPNIAVQTISLMRLHNYLCDKLRALNPRWQDERLYQEARRLLIAVYQHVAYNEFVPILVGRDYARHNKLLPISEGYDGGYDVNLNPTTLASFAAAAYRALHSYIQGFIEMFNEARRVTGSLRLSDVFSKTDMVQSNDNYDSFLRGMLTQKAQEQDQFVTNEVSEFLDRLPNRTDGADLISMDMSRGRDYGLPPYNKFRQLCGLREAKSFKDLSDQISQKNIEALARLYENVNDIDFYVGGMLEKSKPGAILGHTFQCINGEMFYRWKYGDRFFYDFGNQPGSFTLDQLREIRKTTLALMVCLTSDIQSIQRNAFDVPSERNQLVSCRSIPNIDFKYWKDSF